MSDLVYRATIVVEQRNLSDDSVIQTWTMHSKAYDGRSQGAMIWLNRQIRDITETEGRVRDKYRTDTFNGGTSMHKTYETLVEGTGLYKASDWSLVKRGK